MDDKHDSLPWDYFLTNYERDLLRPPHEDMMRKYPGLTRERIESDMIEIQKNQASFVQENGQKEKYMRFS